MDSKPNEPILAFLAYRRKRGEDFARLVYKRLNGASVDLYGNNTCNVEVFCDLFSPPSGDFRENNMPALERARCFILIVTSDAGGRLGCDDWLYKEIDWWLANRPTVAPIVLNAEPDDRDKWIPEPIRTKWPNLNWIPLFIHEDTNDEHAVLSRIFGGIVGRRSAWLESEVAEKQQANIRLRTANRRWKTALTFTILLLVVVLCLAISLYNQIGLARAATVAATLSASQEKKSAEYARTQQLAAEAAKRAALAARATADAATAAANLSAEHEKESAELARTQQGLAEAAKKAALAAKAAAERSALEARIREEEAVFHRAEAVFGRYTAEAEGNRARRLLISLAKIVPKDLLNNPLSRHVVANRRAGKSVWPLASGRASDMDGPIYVIDQLELVYIREKPSNPSIDLILAQSIQIGTTLDGLVAPRPGIAIAQTTIGAILSGSPKRVYASALHHVIVTIRDILTSDGIVGVYVAPDPLQISEDGVDLRKDTGHGMPLRITLATATVVNLRAEKLEPNGEIKTLFANEGSDGEWLCDCPIQPGMLVRGSPELEDFLDEQSRVTNCQIDYFLRAANAPGGVLFIVCVWPFEPYRRPILLNNVNSPFGSEDLFPKHQEVEERLKETMVYLRENHFPTGLAEWYCQRELGLYLERMAEPMGPELYLVHALKLAEASLGPEHLCTIISAIDLGRLYLSCHQFASAERVLLPAAEKSVSRFGPCHDVTQELYETLVDLYEAWSGAEPQGGMREKAALWRQKADALGAKDEVSTKP